MDELLQLLCVHAGDSGYVFIVVIWKFYVYFQKVGRRIEWAIMMN